MSAVDTNRLSARSGNHGLFARMFGAMAEWNDARMTRNALAKLSDRELEDIGLTRYEADHIGR